MHNGYFVQPCEENSLLESMEQIQTVYDQIVDEVSKKIYVNRLLYTMTLDMQYIRNVILLTRVGSEFDCMLDEIGKKPILIYGAGKRGRELVELFPDKNWQGFIDRNKQGYFRNIGIKPLEEYPFIKEAAIIVSNHIGHEEIKTELLKYGIDQDNLYLLEDWNRKAAQDQYFEARCIQSSDVKGGFVDAGSFDGANSISFVKWIRNRDCKIWAFEPDTQQYEICRKNLSPLNAVQLYHTALSEESSYAKMKMDHFGVSHIDNAVKDGTEITMEPLDGLLMGEKIGYIKMDLEGWEEQALRGARQIIRDQRPVLGISVYHKRTDIVNIPNLILSYNPSYKFAFGHYGIVQIDTVLYALPTESKF